MSDGVRRVAYYRYIIAGFLWVEAPPPQEAPRWESDDEEEEDGGVPLLV